MRASELDIERMDFRCADLFSLSFADQTFDLIISFGVFGNGCALSPPLLSSFHQWLTPGGVLLLDTIDATSLPLAKRWRKRLRWLLHKSMSVSLQNAWLRATGWPPCFYCTFSELSKMAHGAGFESFTIEEVPSHLPNGPTRKFQLSAQRSTISSQCSLFDV